MCSEPLCFFYLRAYIRKISETYKFVFGGIVKKLLLDRIDKLPVARIARKIQLEKQNRKEM